MSKHYDEQFKKEIAKEYINGASVKELHEKYGVNKTSIYDWSRKYSNECHNTTDNKDSVANAKEIRELNLRIKELEKENSFLKRSRKDIKDVFAFLRRKSISGISIYR